MSEHVGLGNLPVLRNSKMRCWFWEEAKNFNHCVVQTQYEAISSILCIDACEGTEVFHPTVPSDDAKLLGTEEIGLSINSGIHAASSTCQ